MLVLIPIHTYISTNIDLNDENKTKREFTSRSTTDEYLVLL